MLFAYHMVDCITTQMLVVTILSLLHHNYPLIKKYSVISRQHLPLLFAVFFCQPYIKYQ